MYSKEQYSKIRQQFWTKFGQYMKPVPGAGNKQVNWLNYKTGIPGIHFHMEAGNQQATIAIEIRNKDTYERESYYNHFLSLKTLLENETGYQWDWDKDLLLHHTQVISRISQSLSPVHITKEADWPVIIGFLKPRIMALDKFWESVKDSFE